MFKSDIMSLLIRCVRVWCFSTGALGILWRSEAGDGGFGFGTKPAVAFFGFDVGVVVAAPTGFVVDFLFFRVDFAFDGAAWIRWDGATTIAGEWV